jgi:hypothetical protein
MASLVSGVTKTMCGLTFEPDLGASSKELRWRTAVLPIAGERPLTVGLSSDESGLATLSAAMFAVEKGQVDSSMMNDSLCELVNMTAGLLKSVMSLNQALGLPRILLGPDQAPVPPPSSRLVVLRARTLGLALWICEGLA